MPCLTRSAWSTFRSKVIAPLILTSCDLMVRGRALLQDASHLPTLARAIDQRRQRNQPWGPSQTATLANELLISDIGSDQRHYHRQGSARSRRSSPLSSCSIAAVGGMTNVSTPNSRPSLSACRAEPTQ